MGNSVEKAETTPVVKKNAYEPAYTDVTFHAEVNGKPTPLGTKSFDREEVHFEFSKEATFINE